MVLELEVGQQVQRQRGWRRQRVLRDGQSGQSSPSRAVDALPTSSGAPTHTRSRRQPLPASWCVSLQSIFFLRCFAPAHSRSSHLDAIWRALHAATERRAKELSVRSHFFYSRQFSFQHFGLPIPSETQGTQKPFYLLQL
jgi:hypothetical protein